MNTPRPSGGQMDPRHIFNYLSIGIDDILEGISDGIFILNEQGNFVFVNKVIEDRAGLSLEQFLQLHYTDIIQEEYRPKALQYFTDIFSGKNIPLEEFDYRTADGSIRTIELRGRKIISPGGIPLALFTARNITEKKEAEQARLNALQQKEALFNCISDGIIVFNMNGYITDINPAFEEMTGIPGNEIIGKHGAEIAARILHPHDLNEVLLNFSRATGGERISGIRVRFVHPEKKVFPVFFTTSFLIDKNNKQHGIISIIKDISDLEHIEKSLRQSEDRYRHLAENIMIGLFICEQETGKFLYVNKRLLSLFGYSFDEALAMSIWDVIHPDEHATVIERLTKRRKGEIPPDATYVYTGIKKNGNTLRIEVSITPLAMEGEQIVQGVIRDVTELEALQEQLLHAQKMKAIGTLAGGIAHDFNNILMGIQGNISLVKMELAEDNPIKEMADNIQNLIQQAASLTRQLLGFTRGTKHETVIQNINDIITNSAQIFGRTHKEIIFQMHLHENLWHVKVDRGQIDQVLLNILVNAWQAMPSGGTITIASSNVQLSDTLAPAGIAAGKYVKVSITDTGIGMDEATRLRIFDPFFTTKEMGRGVGLGLTTAYTIIKQHGGFIEVQSEPGKGSVFTIYLPASEKAQDAQQKTIGSIVPGRGTVLLIDDEIPVLSVTAKMLQKLGYDTIMASSGSEAIRHIQSDSAPITCIILDMIMPGTNTVALMAEIRTFRHNVPVILASGYSLEEKLKEVSALGYKVFLQKPFNIEELSIAVKKAIS